MQRIKALLCDKYQLDNRVQQLKNLPKNAVVQSAAAALASIVLSLWFNIRPLGLLFFVIFAFWCYRTRLNIRIQTPPELQKHLQQIEQRLLHWRQTRPIMFCAVASGALGALAIVGHVVTGSVVVLLGLIVAAVVSTKYHFKILQVEHTAEIIEWPEKLHPDIDMDEEFMPEVNETNMFVLERASDLASLTSPTDDAENDEDKSDEVPSELLIPDSIPEIDENSTDDDQDDLMPVVKASKSESEIKANTSSSLAAASSLPVKYSQSGDTIEFKKGHFKRDSSLSTTSSSSEESLSKGLKFPDHTMVDGGSTSKSKALTAPAAAAPHNQEASDMMTLVVKAQTQALLANSSKLIPTLMSGLMQNMLGNSSGPPAKPIDSSDESDFEIVEEEDFQ